MWLIGDLARMVNYLDKQLRANSFSGETGREIKGKHLGIIGFGSIGKKVARIASYGFNMRVHGFGRSSKKEIEDRYRMPIDEFNRLFGLESYTNNIEEILPKCDFVSCHLPLTEDTQGFFNKRLFSQFKKNAYFVNTSRGGIVDEVALNEVLGPGQIKGAALDVYNKEPYAPEKGQKDLRLWNRVVLTPHIASDTKEANTRMARVALDNIYHFFDGEFDEIKRVLWVSDWPPAIVREQTDLDRVNALEALVARLWRHQSHSHYLPSDIAVPSADTWRSLECSVPCRVEPLTKVCLPGYPVLILYIRLVPRQGRRRRT